jgi:hypothetical protein
MASMIVRVTVFSAAAVVLAAPAVSIAETTLDVPKIVAAYGDSSSLQVSCARVASDASGRPRIHCDFRQATVRTPPTAAEVEKEIALREESLRKNPSAFFKGCAAVARDQADPAKNGEFARVSAAWSQACQTKDLSVLMRAWSDYDRQITAHTCNLVQQTWTEDLEYVDASTWVGNSGPRGACNFSYNVTLWRSPKSDPKDPSWWNFRQVRSMPATAPGSCLGSYEATAVSEFRWDANHPRDLGCRYFDL